MYEIRISTLIHCRKRIKADVQKGEAEIERMKRRREGKKKLQNEFNNFSNTKTASAKANDAFDGTTTNAKDDENMRKTANSETKNERMELRPQRTE